MTRPALSSPPTRDRVAHARRAAVDPAPRPDGGFNHAQGLWRMPADMLFVTRVGRRGGPIARRNAPPGRLPASQGWAKGMRADTAHAWDEAGAGRVVIIGCEHRLFVHTLSKNWAMTDRQIGWLQVHPSHGQKTEKMTPPCIASGEKPLWPRPLALRERGKGPPSGARRGDHGIWRPRRRPLRPTGRSIDRVPHPAPDGHWGAGGRVWAPVPRGVHYNWKGPPI
jgi:hypothetical protein